MSRDTNLRGERPVLVHGARHPQPARPRVLQQREVAAVHQQGEAAAVPPQRAGRPRHRQTLPPGHRGHRGLALVHLDQFNLNINRN